MSSANRYDAIVIGAGMSGLAAGIRLAQYDKRVVVLERHSLWGGLNSFYKHGGRRLDTGLHALTNYVPREGSQKAAGTAPLRKILRQLRIEWDDLALGEQSYSEIVFPDARITFSNQFERLAEDVARAFPRERDGFQRLVRAVRECDPFDPHAPPSSARAALGRSIADARLVDMLLCPILYYGGAREDDLDWNDFAILFRSIFLEGLARPAGGIKRILDVLVARYRELGGELRMNCPVARILVDEGVDALGADGECGARAVLLEGGEELEAEHILSSAGWAETMALCGRPVVESEVGRLSFVESITVLDRPHEELGHRATMTFFSTTERFAYRRPQGLIDATSGVICCSDNYASPEPMREGIQRVTVLANHDLWSGLPEPAYREAKVAVADQMHDAAARFVPDPRPYALDRDLFTPRTIRHYTGHLGGAVYGSPKKRRTGTTGIANLSVIGTDQGLCGVVGAMLSGITMANQHVLAVQTARP